MEKVGILYICTGKYKVFWNDFHKTCEKNFLCNCEKHYYIFTDDPDYFKVDNRIHISKIDSLPWPLVTLFRFKYFLSIKDKLQEMDYLFFMNANLIFVKKICSGEFLPRKEKQEELVFTIHPGYLNDKIYNAPFERKSNSKAYVPYNLGKHYVIGALIGGEREAFLKFSLQLNLNIADDLKHNYIARWHDESHINNYVVKNSNYRLLSPSYCFPHGLDADYEKIIDTVGKEKFFNVNEFKGVNLASDKYPRSIVFIVRKAKAAIRRLLFLINILLRTKAN